MSRVVIASGLSMWLGLTLVFSHVRWFARRPTIDRVRPYLPAAYQAKRRPGALSVASFRELAGPLSQLVGNRIARLFGVTEEVEVRLRRTHSPIDAPTFRLRQLFWAILSVVGAAVLSLVLSLGPVLGFALVLGTPLLAFLAIEQQLAIASRRWQRRVFLELPIVGEQLAMLLGAGYSLGGALHRLSERGQGACATDLRIVVKRVGQGLDEVAALKEWSQLVDVPALERLVAVLSLNQQASDLSSLIAEETRSVRRDAHRELIETAERRAQLVWVPVTIATLVPGVIFLAVPFFETLRLFGTS